MVRINLVNPKKLADQHLIAEYNEILMLYAYIKKYPKGEIPKEYCLGKGHMKFFKGKLGYLTKRHELIKKEMRKRGFKTSKSIKGKGDWKPKKKDFDIIKKRIKHKLRPNFYRYYGEIKSKKFFVELLE